MTTLSFIFLIFGILLIASWHDLSSEGERVPNYLTLLLLLFAPFNPKFNIVNSLLGFVVGLLIFFGAHLILYIIDKMKGLPPSQCFGGADIKISAGIGFALSSWEAVLVTVTIAVWLSLIYKIIAPIICKIRKVKYTNKVILFVPYITAGAFFAMLLL